MLYQCDHWPLTNEEEAELNAHAPVEWMSEADVNALAAEHGQ